ncbi:MAG: hypothetical protein QOG62_2495 [Thermoleophilaceae bacterium]|nr:hypothetical protein [Thermoleophilaceae bacterium]
MGALAVINDALEQGRVTATNSDERELQELALAIQADSPEPDPAFAAELRERVSAGFPHEPSPVAEGGRRAAERVRGTLRSAAGRLSGLTPRLTPRYAGGVAAVLLAVAVGGGVISQTINPGTERLTALSVSPKPDKPVSSPPAELLGATRDDAAPTDMDQKFTSSSSGGAEAGSFATPKARTLEAAPANDGAVGGDIIVEPPVPGGPPKQGESLNQRDRQVERSAFITIGAPTDKLADAARGVADTARRHGGFVLSSSMTTGEKSDGGGQFELRVPVDQLDAVLDDLSDLGEVRSMTQDEQDVTSSFESLDDQLKAAQAERKSLLTRLENADTDLEAQGIRRQLKGANQKINGIEADQRQLGKRISYAAVSVTLVKGKGDAGGATAQALDDALAILTASLGILVRIVAVLIPIGIVGGIVWLVVRTTRRRRRESALD